MRVFDEYALRYDQWYERPFGRSAYMLEAECLKRSYSPKDLSLEVGVGSGRFASILGVSYGVDTSIELLKMAKNRDVRCILAKAESLPFKDELFDSVLVVVSLCFFDDPFLSLKEAYRVLRKKGQLLLGLVLSDSKWADFYKEKAKRGHVLYKYAKFFSHSEVISMLKDAGFELKNIYTTLFEDPQDKNPVKNAEIREGFHEEGGFFCLEARKLSP